MQKSLQKPPQSMPEDYSGSEVVFFEKGTKPELLGSPEHFPLVNPEASTYSPRIVSRGSVPTLVLEAVDASPETPELDSAIGARASFSASMILRQRHEVIDRAA